MITEQQQETYIQLTEGCLIWKVIATSEGGQVEDILNPGASRLRLRRLWECGELRGWGSHGLSEPRLPPVLSCRIPTPTCCWVSGAKSYLPSLALITLTARRSSSTKAS